MPHATMKAPKHPRNPAERHVFAPPDEADHCPRNQQVGKGYESITDQVQQQKRPRSTDAKRVRQEPITLSRLRPETGECEHAGGQHGDECQLRLRRVVCSDTHGFHASQFR